MMKSTVWAVAALLAGELAGVAAGQTAPRRCRDGDGVPGVLTIRVESPAGAPLPGASFVIRARRARAFVVKDNGVGDLDREPGALALELPGEHARVEQTAAPPGYERDSKSYSILCCATDDPSTEIDETTPFLRFVHRSLPFLDVAGLVGVTGPHDLPLDGCDGDVMGLAGGGAWGDVDGDGDEDLFTTNLGGPNHLYLYDNLGDGTFREVEIVPDLARPTGRDIGAVFVDDDNDGDSDLFVTGVGGVHVYRNDGTGALRPDPLAGFEVLEGYTQRFTNLSFGDYDGDGFLDAFLTAHILCGDSLNQGDHLFHNEGNGTFIEVTESLEPERARIDNVVHSSFTSVWLDHDRDGDLDIYVANDFFKSGLGQALWKNEGPAAGGDGWRFSDASHSTGVSAKFYAMGAGLGDFNQDGCPDLVVSNIGPTVLWENDCEGGFTNVAASAGVGRGFLEEPETEKVVTWGAGFLDFDNDGDEDIMLAAGRIAVHAVRGQRNLFFENDGTGRFTEISREAGVDRIGRMRALALSDYDRDGFVDMFVSGMGEPHRLYRNMGAENGNENRWLQVRVVGKGAGATNRDGIGAHVRVTTPDGVTRHRWIHSGAEHGSGSSKIAHFGLGVHETADVEVNFPGPAGAFRASPGPVAANQRIVVTEP